MQAIKSASGLIALLFFFIAAGTVDMTPGGFITGAVCGIIGFFFAWVELEEAREMGFLNQN